VTPVVLARHLDGWEEYFWLLEHRVSRMAVLSVEVHGPTTPQAWRRGVQQLVRRTAVLRTGVRPGATGRPVLAGGSTEVPLRVQAAGPDSEVVLAELGQRFGPGEAPLRVRVLHGPDRSTVVLASDHAVLDGRSLVILAADLLGLVQGRPPGPVVELVASQESLLGLDIPADHPADHPAGNAPTRESGPAPALQIDRVQVGPDVLDACVLRARAEATTLHGALVAALMLTRGALGPGWPGPIRCASPVDNRELLGATGALGLYITVRVSELGAPSPDFWSLARQVRADVSGNRTRDSTAADLARVRARIFAGATPEKLVAASIEEAPPLMASNYGRIPSRTGDLRIGAAAPFVTSGAPGAQTVSAATIDGTLTLTNVSQELIPGFLDGVGERLATAGLQS